MHKIKILFIGSDVFSLPSLQSLIHAKYAIAGVLTAPPRPAGRGQKQRHNALAQWATEENLHVVHLNSLRNQESEEILKQFQADLGILVSYGRIVPQNILDLFPYGCLNVHPSLLPRWRGAAPLAHTLLNGDAMCGVTIMKMDAGLDTGPILTQQLFQTPSLSGSAFKNFMAHCGAQLLCHVLPSYLQGTLAVMPQTNDGATYATKFTAEDGCLQWARSSNELERHVQALDPWPGSWFMLNGRRIKVMECSTSQTCTHSHSYDPPGSVYPEFWIKCGDGTFFRPTVVHPENASRMSMQEFLCGLRHMPKMLHMDACVTK